MNGEIANQDWVRYASNEEGIYLAWQSSNPLQAGSEFSFSETVCCLKEERAQSSFLTHNPFLTYNWRGMESCLFQGKQTEIELSTPNSLSVLITITPPAPPYAY